MRKSTTTPQKKKALSYERDHITRGGESKLAWRKAKPLKKRKAVRSFRRKQKVAITKGVDGEAAEKNVQRRLGAFRKGKVVDWGVMTLKEYVDDRAAKRRHIRNKKC